MGPPSPLRVSVRLASLRSSNSHCLELGTTLANSEFLIRPLVTRQSTMKLSHEEVSIVLFGSRHPSKTRIVTRWWNDVRFLAFLPSLDWFCWQLQDPTESQPVSNIPSTLYEPETTDNNEDHVPTDSVTAWSGVRIANGGGLWDCPTSCCGD